MVNKSGILKGWNIPENENMSNFFNNKDNEQISSIEHAR